MAKRYNWIEIQKFYDAGNSTADIRKVYGASGNAVWQAVQRGEFKTRLGTPKLVIQEEIRKQVILLYTSGLSSMDICKKLDISEKVVRRVSEEGGFKFRTLSESLKLSRVTKGRPPMTEENRKALSQRQSLRNTGGRCKWFKVNGISVQGTWERDLATKLTELSIVWDKPKVNTFIWKYVDDSGKEKSYSPDFYLSELNIYLELKGHWWGNDREKMDIIIKTYPDRNLVIIEKPLYVKVLKCCTKEEFYSKIAQ